MRHKRSIYLWTGVLAILLIASVGAFLSRRETVIQGKRVSAWALELRGPGPTETAQSVLRSAGDSAVPTLTAMLRHRDPPWTKPVRAIASKLPPTLRIALHRLAQPDRARDRRTAGILGLALLGTNATPALPALAEALEDPHLPISFLAASTLGRFGSIGVPSLTQALASSRATTRHAACHGLALAGPSARSAIPALVRVLHRVSDALWAQAALAQLGPAALTAVAAALEESKDESAVPLLRFFGQVGSAAHRQAPQLERWSRHPNVAVRQAAVESLGLICPTCEGARSALVAALTDATHLISPSVLEVWQRDAATVAWITQELERQQSEGDQAARSSAQLAWKRWQSRTNKTVNRMNPAGSSTTPLSPP